MEKPRSGLSEKYDQRYSESDKVFGGGRPEAFVLEGATLIPKDAKVIEFGAGQGRNALALAQRGFQVSAIDISRVGVEAMNRFAEKESLSNFKAEVGDAREGLTKEYDFVVSTFMLHHLTRQEAEAFIRNIKEHTREGGLNAIAAFTVEGDFSKTDRVHFYPALGEIKELYSDWEVLSYNEGDGWAKATHPDGTPMFNIKAEILVRKPKS
ncbi:MAG TPA: methyltransferase domain-containing protein [Candidatus Paceibacterota bacterium]|nr:methyltransferase domain-containing protein [Candidatus Paceibacterota bacterium]